MANYLKFRVTNKVGDKKVVFGNLGPYTAGTTFVCSADQANRWIKEVDLASGFIELLGEVDGTDDYSSNMRTYLEGRPGLNKNNVLPVSEFILTSNSVTTPQGLELAGNNKIGRRVVIDKFLVNHTAPSQATNAPVLLMSAGYPVTTVPTNVIGYDVSAGTYHVQANNTVSANITGTTAWANGDQILIGYHEKFASVMWTIDTASTGVTSVTAKYWNGSQWITFGTTTDLTRLALGNATLGRTHDNTRTIWWEKPTNWKKGGPIGSRCDNNSYYVALELTHGSTSALASLAGAIPYPVMDRPLAWGSLGINHYTPNAVVTVIDGVIADRTKQSVPLTGFDATDDYIYIGFNQLYRGIYVDMSSSVNAQAGDTSASYWNGRTWVNTTITDGTDTGPGFAQDGSIVINTIPFDWVPAVAEANLGFTPPTTVVNTPLYWIRLAYSATMTNGTEIAALYALPPTNQWFEFNAHPASFVDAEEPLKIFVNDAESNVAGLVVKAVVADV